MSVKTIQAFQPPIRLESSRLILRPWIDTDFECFYALNSDPEVMKFFPQCLNRLESQELANRFQRLIDQNGWGFWAVELKHTHQFIGFVGLNNQPDQFSFSPCIEIGWRLAKSFWHQGYATEAAEACLHFAFHELALEQVISFTAKLNLPSQKVMQRLNMTWVSEFNHPKLDRQHPLARHVLYALSRPVFLNHE